MSVVFFGDSANMGSALYSLYFSADSGETFSRRSTLPFDPANYYCTAAVLDNDEFIVYSYPHKGQETDEHNMHYAISQEEQASPKLLIQSSISYNRETARVTAGQWWIKDISGSSLPTGE